jgi:predicted RNA binding protein YcfA (HicA-like mRNA interferase family)
LAWAKLVKIRDLLKALQRDGWVLKNQEGSHRQFIHPVRSGKVTVAGHPYEELDPQTKKSILKQAGLA